MRWLSLGMLVAGLSACGGGEPPPSAPVQQETAEDSVLRVGRVWRSAMEDKSLRSPPSKISVLQTRVTSTIKLVAGQKKADEELLVEELIEMRDGGRFECVSSGKVRVSLSYGRWHGEAAMQLARPQVGLRRRCQPANPAEPEVVIEQTTARFALRGDQLVAFAPTLDKRVYLPTD